MKVLILEKNLLMLSRLRSSLAEREVKVGESYGGEDIVFINIETYPVEKIKEYKSAGAKVVAYCGHKNLELMQRAKEMGADLVVPNSRVVHAKELLGEL